jgi:hypothetical protein
VCLVVDVDDQLARHHAVAKRHDPRTFLEADVGDETRRESLVDGPDVAERCPHVLGTCRDLNFPAD